MNRIWNTLDNNREELLARGFIKFPPLSALVDPQPYAENILKEVNGKTFSTSSPTHKKLLDTLGVKSALAPTLFDIARQAFGYKGGIDNQYHIARLVQPGNSVEQYRTHFDSHLFTLVIPLVIPTASPQEETGELLFKPNARRNPRSELENVIGKARFKRYANRESALKLVQNNTFQMECFSDLRPLLFIGRTTLHANKAVTAGASSERLTLLAHFFDPSPKYGVGNLLRALRKR